MGETVSHGFSNFQIVPAPFAVLAFLGFGFLEVIAVASAVWGVVTRRPRLARIARTSGAVAAVVYLAALVGLSAFSRERVLDPGEEKYFCEVDCHLAYSVVAVQSAGTRQAVTLRVRFDEDTIAPWRPRGFLLAPNSRLVRVVGAEGRAYAPEGEAGRDALRAQPLRPGESDLARLVFELPPGVKDARLSITEAAWPTRLLLGHENSLFHRKVSFGLSSPSPSGRGSG